MENSMNYRKIKMFIITLILSSYFKCLYGLPFVDLFAARGELIHFNGSEHLVNCDGVMILDPEISPEAFFLTAAHCSSDQMIGIYYSAQDTFIPIKKSIKHPLFNSDPSDQIAISNDIMVIKVDQEAFKKSGIKSTTIFKGEIYVNNPDTYFDVSEKKIFEATMVFRNESDFSITSIPNYIKYYKSPINFNAIKHEYDLYLIGNAEFLEQLCTPPYNYYFKEICSGWNQEQVKLIGDAVSVKLVGFSKDNHRGILVCREDKCVGKGESGSAIYINRNKDQPDYQAFGIVSSGPGIFGQYFQFVHMKSHLDFIKSAMRSMN